MAQFNAQGETLLAESPYRSFHLLSDIHDRSLGLRVTL